jgi:undecaprenyl diphosphate synthase
VVVEKVNDESLRNRKTTLKGNILPRHVAIIMDGNGRWARQQNLSRIDGHRAGIEAVRRVVRLAGELGIGYLTLYTFSSENWARPPAEVMGLMSLLEKTLEQEVPELNKNNVRIQTIGDTSRLPQRSRDALTRAIKATSSNDGLTLILALNYGARDEIIHAIRALAVQVQNGTLKPDSINHGIFESCLYTAGIPDPDLLMRTSGEYRISNFLLWQCAYTELYITDVMWPDFGESDFLDAIESYCDRERRFGKTSQQISDFAKKVTQFVIKGVRKS